MTATSVVCPECGSPVAPGRLSCQACGTLLASVVGSSRRYANSPVIDPMLPDVDEDRPIASARRLEPDVDALPTPPPIVVEPDPPVAALPPAQPAKRAPRRLPRPRQAVEPTAASIDVQAQTSIFGPVPNVAPPILQDWSDPAAGRTATGTSSEADAAAVTAGVATATRPTKAPRQPRPADPPSQPRPADAPRNGSGMVPIETPPAAPANGTGLGGASVAGAYLAPSATYAAPVARPPSTPTGTARAGSALAASVPTWPDPYRATVPTGSANGGHPMNGASIVASGPVADHGAAARRMSDWLVIGGSTLAIVSFVLPWATDGVLGSRGIGYTAEWGLANLGHLLLIAAAITVLALHLIENRVPGWIRSGVLPIAVGGLLAGLAFAYYARPFGGGAGVAVLLAGAVLLLVGGVAASRPERHEPGAPTV